MSRVVGLGEITGTRGRAVTKVVIVVTGRGESRSNQVSVERVVRRSRLMYFISLIRSINPPLLFDQLIERLNKINLFKRADSTQRKQLRYYTERFKNTLLDSYRLNLFLLLTLLFVTKTWTIVSLESISLWKRLSPSFFRVEHTISIVKTLMLKKNLL